MFSMGSLMTNLEGLVLIDCDKGGTLLDSSTISSSSGGGLKSKRSTNRLSGFMFSSSDFVPSDM